MGQAPCGGGNDDAGRGVADPTRAGRSEKDELGWIEEAVEEEETTAAELPTEAVKFWPEKLATEFADETITDGVALAPPDDDDGATTVPTEASATAPSMMSDTTMANPIARLRGERRYAFIPYLGDWNEGTTELPVQERARDPAEPSLVRRESCWTLPCFFSATRPLADATTPVEVVTARQFVFTTVG
jgi:hypothetical protein